MTKSGSEFRNKKNFAKKSVCSKENSLPQTENFIDFVKYFSEWQREFMKHAIVISLIYQLLLLLFSQ